jgi:primosomal protein N'
VPSSASILKTAAIDARADAASLKSSPQYAEIAVPLRVMQTYTYRLPLALQTEAQVGARLVVPFGRKRLTGYIVALHEELDPGTDWNEVEIKEAEELLDSEPLLTPEIIDITRWVSEYYAALNVKGVAMSVQYILSEYLDRAMARAEYDKLEDKTFSGRIASCKGVVAFGATLRECEDELRSSLEDWLLLGLKFGHTLPVVDGIDLNREPVYESLESV